MEEKIQKLNQKDLCNIIMQMAQILDDQQRESLQAMVEKTITAQDVVKEKLTLRKMDQEFVDEKLEQLEEWKRQIEKGELYLETEEYEDYSNGYWEPDWITEYCDTQNIGNKIMSMIEFARDCVYDCRYREAYDLYEWLWEVSVSTDSDWEEEVVDLEVLEENHIIKTDMEQVALLTLYTSYQVVSPKERAEELYSYFGMSTFQKIHMEDIFRMGREDLTEAKQFWNDWIALLKIKSGDVETRLLREAVLYQEGLDGLEKIAEEESKLHPSLYLTVIDEYAKKHAYDRIELLGVRALKKLDVDLVIRSKIALKTACAAETLLHTECMMQACWECFRSDTTVRNFLRLFATKELAEQYGIRGKEILQHCVKSERELYSSYYSNEELRRNIIPKDTVAILQFYTGDFVAVKEKSRNPRGSLGWSSQFIRIGIRLFLLYLYERIGLTKASAAIVGQVGFYNSNVSEDALEFERKLIAETEQGKNSQFWIYFQTWKQYYPMEKEKKIRYLKWVEKIVYSRTDAIVSGQHRGQYDEVAALLAAVSEIKEDLECSLPGENIYMEYKKKFPRHSSFQAEMRIYFGK